MSDDLVQQSIAEMQDLVRCRCHPAYKDRGMHDPDCECDSADAVKVVIDYIAQLEEYKALYGGLFKAAAARIEELEAKLDKAVDFCRRLERLVMQSEDWFVFDKCQEILDQLLDKTDA